jgi:sulfoxide reductase heme-binding subunit YedZ
MFSTRNFNRSKPILFILILFPSLLWAYQFVTGNLGVNPIEKLMDELGLMALKLIIITLMITTLSNIRPLKSIVVLRRMIGLFAFYYVCLHFSTYIVLDHFFRYAIYHTRYYKKTIYNFWFYKFSFFNPTC